LLEDGVRRYDLIVYDVGMDENGDFSILGETNLTRAAGGLLSTLADESNVAWQRYHATWARGSDRIVASVFEVIDGKDNIDLWEIDADDPAGAFRLTDTSESAGPSHLVQERHACFSPDDAKLVYRLRAGRKDSGIYVMNANGSGTPELILKSEDVRSPAWRR
jgi:hypothetical protein